MARRKEAQPGLARALRQLRAERDMSQEQLAHLADVHPTWISHLESGRANPAWGTMQRVSQGLGIRLSELVALSEQLAEQDPS